MRVQKGQPDSPKLNEVPQQMIKYGMQMPPQLAEKMNPPQAPYYNLNN